MRLSVSFLAFLVSATVEWSAEAGQIRGGDLMQIGDVGANIIGNMGAEMETKKAEDVDTKSKKKKDTTANTNTEVSDDDANNVDDDGAAADDDGAAADDDGISDDDENPSTEPDDDIQLRDLFFPCQLLQSQFDLPISCQVDIFDSLISDRSVGAIVELNDPLCTPTIVNRKACVSPIYSAYFGLSNFAITSRVDFTNITVGEFQLGDIGIELERCGAGSGLSNTFCGCEATYDGNVCSSCEICGNGNPFNAIKFDCTNLVPFLANFNSCENINVLQNLKDGTMQISVPSFIKELEFR